MKRIQTAALAVALMLVFAVGTQAAVTIFEDSFDDNPGLAGWQKSHASYVSRYTSSPRVGVASLRLRYNKNTVTCIKVSPFKNMKLSFKLAAYSLESGEKVVCEYSTGGSWITAKTLYNGSDNRVFRSYSVSIPNCTVLKIRVRLIANSSYDYAYVDDIKLTGDRK